HSDHLELELARRKIPFVKYGGIRYLEAAHVKDFLALLRIAANPGEHLSWFRLLQLLEGIGPVLARRLLERLLGGQHDPASIHVRWQELELVPASARKPGAAVLAALAASEGHPAGIAAERLRDALAPLIRSRYPDGEVRLVDLDQLVGAAAAATRLDRFV